MTGGGITNTSLLIYSSSKKVVLISIVCNSQSFWTVNPNNAREVFLEHVGDSFSLLLRQSSSNLRAVNPRVGFNPVSVGFIDHTQHSDKQR